MFAAAAHTGLVRTLRQERVLLWCVLASIALHALVFLVFSQREAPAPPARALLVLSARLAPVATAPAEAPVQPHPEPRPRVVTPPAPKPVHPPAPRPEPVKPVLAPAPAAHAKAPAEPARAAPPEPVPAVPTAPAAPTGADVAIASAKPGAASSGGALLPPQAGLATEATAKSGSDADAGTKEQYRLALIMATRRYKRYPALAMEKGWQGRVEVRMVIGANGMLASTSIKASSGHAILDNQAVDMLKKGKTTVQIPASLRGREFSVDVPVIFDLGNPNS